ncbi:MAG: hypothetical protein FD145_870 [Candidatus Saganbacteria bacterium]|uniref:Four helix bundle protein n=1 Tax=Candidatus Saganbacteria bacterium TaxID=2575572 RepID=A0A833NZW4_UNCSA|nr:MAG: hypothetical protein FD145_870 [Candidatus Saganbacteria bacterium]
MKKYDLRERSYGFSLELVKFLNNLSLSKLSMLLISQLIRSGTSIGANIEEADSSPTRKDYKYKMVVAKKEAAETKYWIRLIIESGALKNDNNIIKANELLDEANQLLKILGSIVIKL